MPPPSGFPEEYEQAMQLHSAATSSSNLTGNADDFQQLPVVQAPGSPGAVTRSARRFAALHRAARECLLEYLLTTYYSARYGRKKAHSVGALFANPARRGTPAVPNFARPQHLRASSMAAATARRCGSCASRHTCTLASAVAYRREVPSVPPAKTVFKRKLPSGLVPFSSPAGRSFFMQAPAARSRLPCLAPRRSPASHRLPPPPLRRRCRATRWSHSSRCRSSSLHRRSRRTARWAR